MSLFALPVSNFSIADFVLLETSTFLDGIATNSFFALTLCHHRKSVASKLHGVEVEITVIKRKGDPLYDDNISSSGIVEATTPANEMATACLHQQPPLRQRQQLSRQQQQDGVSDQQCRENRDDNKLLSNNINNANILSNSNINSSNSISNSQGNLSFFPSTFFFLLSVLFRSKECSVVLR